MQSSKKEINAKKQNQKKNKEKIARKSRLDISVAAWLVREGA